MALAIDASSPATATQTNGATATVTTASFTPPSGSVLLIRWSANTQSGVDPSTPTITDSLTPDLTYTLSDWSHRGDGPTADGQAAIWTAPVVTSAAMTITVTNAASSGNRHAALRVTVLTGADTTTAVGANGKSGSTSAASIAQNYTAEATGGWGFISVCDWDVVGNQTAGTGCTLDGSGAPGSAITYGFLRRTTADDVNTSTNTLNVTLPGTSGNLRWAYAEVMPAAGGTDATATPAVVAVTSTVPRPNVNTAAAPVVVAAVGALPRADVNVGAGPSTVAAVAALPRADVNITAGPAVVVVTAAVPQLNINVTAGPAVIPLVVSVPTPTVIAGGNATATPDVIAVTAAVPRPDVNVASGPAVIPVTVTVPQAALDVTAGPSVVATTVTLPRPDINVTAGPDVIVAAVALPAAELNVTAGPAVIPVTVALATPSVGGSTAATPATIVATVTLPQPGVNVAAAPAVITVTVTLPLVTIPGQLANADSTAVVTAAYASVAAVTAARTSSTTVTASRTSVATVED